MMQFLTIMRQQDFDCTKKAAAGSAGISYQTTIKWTRKPGFKEWFEGEKRAHLAKKENDLTARKLQLATGEYKATDQQIALLAKCLDCGFLAAPSSFAEDVGVTQQAISEWFGKPEFRAWWKRESKEFFGKDMPKVYRNIHMRATNINAKPQDLKLYMEVFGEPKASRLDVTFGFDEAMLEYAANRGTSETPAKSRVVHSRVLEGDREGRGD
jgi:hypothetical protein